MIEKNYYKDIKLDTLANHVVLANIIFLVCLNVIRDIVLMNIY